MLGRPLAVLVRGEAVVSVLSIAIGLANGSISVIGSPNAILG